MGISRATLGILAFGSLFVTIAMLHGLSVSVLTQVNNIPVTSVSAQAIQDGLTGETSLILSFRSSGGTPVELQFITVETDKGTITIDVKTPPSDIVRLVKTNYVETLHPGGTSELVLVFKPGYFTVGNGYSGIVHMSAGTHPIFFVVRALLSRLENKQVQLPLRPVIPVAHIERSYTDLISLISENLYGSANAFFGLTEDGDLTISSTPGSKFGGLALVYSSVNVEHDLKQGLFFIARVYVNSSSIPGVFGVGFYLRLEDRNSPEERLVFVGLNATRSDRVNFTIAYLNVDGRGAINPGFPDSNTTLVNITLNEWYIIVVYANRTGQNDLTVTGYLYEGSKIEGNRWSLRLISQCSLLVKLPGTPGNPIVLYPSLVSKGSTIYDYAVLAFTFGVEVCGVPSGYVIEIPCINYRVTSTGRCIAIPIPELPEGTSIHVYYPNGLLSARYEVAGDLHIGTRLIFRIADPARTILAEGVAIRVRGYISGSPNMITGLVVTNMTNTNQAVARVKLFLIRELSNVSGQLTLNITVVDKDGRQLVENPVHVYNGRLESDTTSWSIRPLYPGEEFLVYITGYFNKPGSTATIVLGVEFYIEDASGLYENTVRGQPILIHLEGLK